MSRKGGSLRSLDSQREMLRVAGAAAGDDSRETNIVVVQPMTNPGVAKKRRLMVTSGICRES